MPLLLLGAVAVVFVVLEARYDPDAASGPADSGKIVLADGTVWNPYPKSLVDTVGEPVVDVLHGIGGAVIIPASEFLGVRPSDGIYRWVGAASPFLLGFIFWFVPSPFARKKKPAA